MMLLSMRLDVARGDVNGQLDAAVIAEATTIAILACPTDVECILDFTSAINHRKDRQWETKAARKIRIRARSKKQRSMNKRQKGRRRRTARRANRNCTARKAMHY